MGTELMKCNSRRLLLLLIALLVAGIVSACAGMKNPADMNAKEMFVWASHVYSAQYDSYVTDAEQPNLTEEKKEVMRKKKALLIELQPKLLLLGSYVETGTLPEQQTTDAIIELVEKLANL